MSIRLRFAPSPTGRLHVGNVRTALLNWLFALREGGQVLLRIDDTDLARSTKAFENGIEADLTWLGLAWAERANQSRRFDAYERAAAALKAAGLLYPCYETEDELDRRRKIAQATGKPPVYDRAALKLTEADRARLEGEGRKPHWRFKLSGARKDWVDLVRGPQSIDTASLSDPVLIREDGAFLYTLPSVVDDIDFKITHIVRGEDHVTNSGVQIEIFEALGGQAPAFGHFPLLVGADGGALSKRLGSLSVQDLREEGFEPIAVLSHLAKIGTSDPVEARQSIAQLADEFAFEKIGRAPARFDPEELKRVNAAVLHQLGYAAVKDRLAALGADKGEAFWNAIRANIALLPEARRWAHIVDGPIEPFIADSAFAAAAAEALPAGAYDGASWQAFTNAVKEKTGAKGKALFMPLRQALTGLDHGPEMGALFPLIGEARARKRLLGETA
ncbi:MAG: glutamate--tRNA ligase [Hyphomonadaceae bacterium]|nr:glutamate--tRNA ligase [Hyphomonadaceae bacterium]MBX3511792.1 glutamate--tRNA ligase [Hyphomonadaceae bacterium]